MEKKVFVQGFGRLTADQLNMMLESAIDFKTNNPPFKAPSWYGPYLAIINPPSGVAPQELATDSNGDAYKWGYDFVIISPEFNEKDGEYLFEANSQCYMSTGEGAGDSPTALNLCEINNSEAVQMGVQTNNLQGTFKLQPVPDITHTFIWLCPMPYVDETSTNVGETGWLALFSYPNQFDGTCD